MSKLRIGQFPLTDEGERTWINLLGEPTTAVGFVRSLENLAVQLKRELDKTMDVYLVNDDPATRALALKIKGKIELVNELAQLAGKVTK